MSTDNKELQAVIDSQNNSTADNTQTKPTSSIQEDEEALINEAHEVIASAIVKNELQKDDKEEEDESQAALGADGKDVDTKSVNTQKVYQKDPTVLISKESKMYRQITFALGRLKSDEVVTFSAFAVNIQKAIQMVEIIKRRVGFLHQESELCFMEYKRKAQKKEDAASGSDENKENATDEKEFTRRVTGMKIKLSKQPLDTTAVGYQKPKPRDNYSRQEYRRRQRSQSKAKANDQASKKDSQAASKPTDKNDSSEAQKSSRKQSKSKRKPRSKSTAVVQKDSPKAKESLVIVKDENRKPSKNEKTQAKETSQKRPKRRNQNKQKDQENNQKTDQKSQKSQKETQKDTSLQAKKEQQQFDTKSERDRRQQPAKGQGLYGVRQQYQGYNDQFYRQPPFMRGDYDPQQQRRYQRPPYAQQNQMYGQGGPYQRRPLQMYNGPRQEGGYRDFQQQQRPQFRNRPGFFPGSGKQFKTERQGYGFGEREARDNEQRNSQRYQNDFQGRRARSRSQNNVKDNFETQSHYSSYTTQERRNSGFNKQLRV